MARSRKAYNFRQSFDQKQGLLSAYQTVPLKGCTMAGYLFAFNNKQSLFDCVRSGIYSTLMKEKRSVVTSSTFADFATMKPGDSVYFFSKREVFGIGEIVSILPGSAFLDDYVGASSGRNKAQEDDSLMKYIGASNQEVPDGIIHRWIIAFKPAPYFFSQGVDMDDLLASNPIDFRSLRVFWKRSFIKFDDEEDLAFKSAILRANLQHLQSPKKPGLISCEYSASIAKLRGKPDIFSHKPDFFSYLAKRRNAKGALSSEMDLEAGLLLQLSAKDENAVQAFGSWDYLSHQVHASPSKAVDYMDKMDVFGYSFIPNYPIISRYLVAELKKDKATVQDLYQLMKYVDWVRSEYAGNDYGLIRAFLVAHEFDEKGISAHIEDAERSYLLNRRPPSTKQWRDITFVRYFVEESGAIRFASFSLV